MTWLLVYLAVSTVAAVCWARVGWVLRERRRIDRAELRVAVARAWAVVDPRLRGPSVDERAAQAQAMVAESWTRGDQAAFDAWTEDPR